MANARAAHRPAVAPLRFGTALFAMVLLVFALAQAAPSATPLRVVYAGDAGYPPFDFVDERGRATGFDVELFRAVAAHAGLDVDYRLGPWESVIADLHARRVDVVPMLVTEERARRLRFSEPFLRSYHLVFGRRGSAHVADLQALAGHRVAAQIAGVAGSEVTGAVWVTFDKTENQWGVEDKGMVMSQPALTMGELRRSIAVLTDRAVRASR